MLIAAINALSYFFLSHGLTDLVGMKPAVEEAIGFPFAIWEEGHARGAHYIDIWGAGKNVLVGVLLGTFFGLIGILLRHQFNEWVAEFEEQNQQAQSLSAQFSIKSAMFCTLVAALLVALITRWNGSSFGLGAIYLLGPSTLIGIAMFPDQLHWKVRATIVAVLSLALIGIAARSGLQLNMDIDRVMLGFFVCWTPQTVFAAFIIVVAFVIRALRMKLTAPLTAS